MQKVQLFELNMDFELGRALVFILSLSATTSQNLIPIRSLTYNFLDNVQKFYFSPLEEDDLIMACIFIHLSSLISGIPLLLLHLSLEFDNPHFIGLASFKKMEKHVAMYLTLPIQLERCGMRSRL